MGILAIVALVLTLAGVAVLGALSGGASLGSPFIDPAALVARYASAPLATRWAALLQFGSAVPLGIFAATVSARQARLGIRVPGPTIGLVGGVTASLMLMVSALSAWTLSWPAAVSSPSTVVALSYFSFATGGVGYAVGIGLLVAGIAVPAYVLRLFPRWLALTGLVIAAIAELTFLSLAIDPLQYLIPIARFGGGLWLIAAGFSLPRERARRTAAQQNDPGAVASR